MNPIKPILLAALLLSGCQAFQDESRRSKIARFAVKHPIAAAAIGVETEQSTNITTNAVRFALRTGLDNKKNGEGRGTQVNAVRHALWQAAITSQFDESTAEEIGNAYENDTELREGKTDYFSRLAADQAVDLRNNRIGRSIGSNKPKSDMKTLAQAVLQHYRDDGLWTAREEKSGNRRTWRISQTKLSEQEYRSALQNLEPLNQNGMTEQEQAKKATEAPSEIKETIKVLREKY